MLPRFCEYYVKKLRFPTCSRQENAIFHLIFTEPGKRTLAHPCTDKVSDRDSDWGVSKVPK